MPEWTFITNHGLVLDSIAKHTERTAREIGYDAGITERTTHKIIMDLEKDGYITKIKVGRQNTYRIHHDAPIKTGDASIGELLMILSWKRRKKRTKIDIPDNAD